MISAEEQGQIEQYSYQQGHPEKERSPMSWIQKYLDLADLLIKRGRHADDHEHVN